MQIVQVRNDLLSKLGIEDATTAPALVLQDVVLAINGAMQTLQMAGQDYFTREHITLALGAGTALYTIARTIQAVIGPVRWNDEVPLRALLSRGELDQFGRIFLGETTFGMPTGDPIAYWIENLRQGTTGDIDQINIYLAPIPESPAGELNFDVINDAPTYAVADLTSTAELPVAQNYCESLFLPLARLLMTRSYQFSRPDILAGIQADAQVAMQTLGYGGGFPNAEQPGPMRKVSA